MKYLHCIALAYCQTSWIFGQHGYLDIIEYSDMRIFINRRYLDILRMNIQIRWGPTLRSNGKCSNENAIMDNDLMEYDLIGK